MKVLLWTRPNDNILGGDLRQAINTKIALEKIGLEVDLIDNYGIEQWKLEKYDIIHIFVLNLVNNYDKIKAINKNLVITPIYRDPNYGE